MSEGSYTRNKQEKLPEPETTPCEEARVVNKPYEGTTVKTIGSKNLVNEIGKMTGDKS